MRREYYLCSKHWNVDMLLGTFRRYLSNLGSTQEIEEDGKITFRRYNLSYMFAYDRRDPNYFRLIVPNIERVNGNADKYQSLLNTVNKNYKAVKIYIADNDMLWIAIEQFVYSLDNLNSLYDRCVELLQMIVSALRDEFKKLKADE